MMITNTPSINNINNFFARIPIPLCTVSYEGKFLAVNEKFTNVFGYSLETVPNMIDWIAQSNHLAKKRERGLGRLINQLRFKKEISPIAFSLLDNKCDKIDVEISISLLPEAFLITLLDVTERNKEHQLVYELAFYDLLTKLANRRLLYDRFTKLLATHKRACSYGIFMVIDLDKFKPLNDIYGHLTGDSVLVDVANRLKSSIREIDTVARFGGDEFVVLIGDGITSKESANNIAAAIAKRIQYTLAIPHFVKNPKTQEIDEYFCTGSIGVSIFNGCDQLDIDTIIHNADNAMYNSKNNGRNSFSIHK